MDTKFAVRKSNSFGYFLLISVIVIGFATIGLPLLADDSFNITGLIAGLIITTLVSGLFLWIWISTNYIIDNDFLIAKSGPLIWRVPIREISYVRLNQKTIGGTWKPTLSWNCIEIRYKKYRSIFITPEKQNDFLGQLKQINDNIEMKEK
jgi:hypothetical protein